MKKNSPEVKHSPALSALQPLSLTYQYPPTVTAFDTELRHIIVGTSAASLFRLAPDGVQGKKPREFLPGDICEILEPLYHRALSGETAESEISFVKRLFSITCSPIRNNSGSILLGLVVCIDITDRRQGDAALLESGRRYSDVLSKVDLISITLDQNGHVTFCNNYLLALTGWRREDLIGVNWFEQFVPRRGEDLKAMYAEMLKDMATVWHNESEVLTSSGERRLIRWNNSALRSGSGEVVGAACIGEDITDRQKVQDQLLRLRKAVESSGEVIFVTDREGFFSYINPAFTHLYGYSEDDVIGKATPRILKSGGMTPEDYHGLWEKILGKGSFRGELINRTKDGLLVAVEASANAILNEKEEIVGFLAIQRDVSLRKQMEEELHNSRETYRELVENINEVIFSTDLNGILTYVSPVIKSITGFSPEEILGAHFDTIVLPEDRVQLRPILSRVIKGNREMAEFRVNTKSGNTIWVEVSARPFILGGQIIGVGGVATDITERRKLELQLFQSQKLESLGTLAGGIAHDFNNVLAIILGHISLLVKHIDDSERRTKSVDAISNAVQRGAGLVRQLLTFARKSDIFVQKVMVDEIIDEVVKLLHETFPRTISIEVHSEPGTPSVLADPTQLHQILLNLCVNARDAMLPDGGTLTLSHGKAGQDSVRSRFPQADSPAYAEITVADTGTGIDEETKARIFEPFFTTKELGKGTGLGLSTVYGIVERHQGYVAVDTTVGKGTTFHVFLPAQTTDDSSEPVPETSPTEPEGGSETILVVEDEEMIREMMKAFLEGKGYNVITASNGLNGIEAFRKYHRTISLVLSDIGLPGIPGDKMFLELLKINPDVPVILASGYLEPGQRSALLASGASDVVQKPYVPNDILRKLRAAIDR